MTDSTVRILDVDRDKCTATILITGIAAHGDLYDPDGFQEVYKLPLHELLPATQELERAGFRLIEGNA